MGPVILYEPGTRPGLCDDSFVERCEEDLLKKIFTKTLLIVKIAAILMMIKTTTAKS